MYAVNDASGLPASISLGASSVIVLELTPLIESSSSTGALNVLQPAMKTRETAKKIRSTTPKPLLLFITLSPAIRQPDESAGELKKS